MAFHLPYLNSERITHGIKTALACLIGFIVVQTVHFDVDQWLIISIIVVMCAQINVGSVVQKSYMRFIGTLTGSIIAMLTLFFFGKNEIAFAVIIPLSAMLFSYIATGPQSYNEAGTLGAATVVIILIGKDPTFITALERFIEISMGLFIAAFVSQFVLPVHARQHLRQTQATTLRQLRDFYETTSVETIDHYQTMDENIAQSLIKQRKLSLEAGREPLGIAFDLSHFQQLLRVEKEILRTISVMHHAFIALIDIKNIFCTETMRVFHDEVCEALTNSAACIEQKKTSIRLPSIQALKNSVALQSNDLSPDKLVILNAYLFAADMLVAELSKLVLLVEAIPLAEPRKKE